MDMEKKCRYDILDDLRGIAAILVVVFLVCACNHLVLATQDNPNGFDCVDICKG